MTSSANLTATRTHSLDLASDSQCQGECPKYAVENCLGIVGSRPFTRSRRIFRLIVLAEIVVMNCSAKQSASANQKAYIQEPSSEGMLRPQMNHLTAAVVMPVPIGASVSGSIAVIHDRQV